MFAIVISLITIILIILSIILFPSIKIKNLEIPTYLVISILGALLILFSKSVSLDTLSSSFAYENSMNPWKILILFISMTILSIFLDEIGLFKYLANIMVNKLGKNQYKLFFGFYIFLSLLTVFTSNDIIILTFTPFLCYYTKRANINPLPYLVEEFVASNTWSMVLIVGNPTNIYIASSFNIDFFYYLKMMILPTLLASIVSLFILYLLFRKDLKQEMKVEEIEYEKPNKFLTVIGLIHLLSCIVLVAISNYLNLQMWLITLSFCISLSLVYLLYKLFKKDKNRYLLCTLKRAPWSLIPFVLSMFILVLSLKENGITQEFSSLFNDNVFIYGISGSVVANLINNIPMSVLYTEVLYGASIKSILSSIIASNLAAFMTPFGALAGIMWIKLIEKYNVKYSFLSFIKYGLTIGIPTLISAITVLYLL